jgi:hypothetical protein
MAAQKLALGHDTESSPRAKSLSDWSTGEGDDHDDPL